MKKLCAVLAAAAIVCSTGVMAQNKTAKSTTSEQSGKAMTMKQLDKNNDGYISRSEADANATVSGEFADLDANKDGRLSASEFAKHK